jgi:streptogramin lyase
MPGGAVLSYGRSNGVYRWIGDDFAYNINVAATVATAPGGPLTPAGSNYLLTLPYPVLSASYPTATIIGDLWLTTTNPTEGAGTSNMFKAYAATIPTNANAATIRALTGTTDESLAVLSVGTQFTLQGTLVYRTTTINQSFTVPALYTQSSVIQDQDGNLGINLPPPTMPRGGFDIYSSNAVIPALVVDQRSTGDIVSLREAGVAVVTVDGNGNVGIGTTTPVAPLHVIGKLMVDNVEAMSGTLAISSSTTVGSLSVTSEATVADLDITGYNYAPVSAAPHVAFSVATSNVFLKWLQRTMSAVAGSWWQTAATPIYGTISGAPGGAAYWGSVLIPDGRVIFVPNHATTIGIFTPTTNAYTTVAGMPGGDAYRGGVLLQDGRVVFVPSIAQTIGIYNPITNTYNTVARGTGSYAYVGGVLLPDGRVLFVPDSVPTIGIFNPTTNAYSTIAANTSYYGGVLLPDGRVVLVPSSATAIGIFNPTTNTYSTVCDVGAASGKYIGGVLLPDGRVVFVPLGTTIGIFNPATNVYSTIGGMPGSSFYRGGALLPDGRVAFVPLNGTTIGIFNPATNAYSTVAIGTAISGGAYASATLLPDGRMVFTPYYATTIGILSGFPRASPELCYHPCFNKF